MRKTLIALATGAAIVLTGTAAHAGTNPPPIGTVTGGNPVVTRPPIVVKGGAPVVKHHKAKRHVVAAQDRITTLPHTGGFYTAGLEGGLLLLGAGVALTVAGRKVQPCASSTSSSSAAVPTPA